MFTDHLTRAIAAARTPQLDHLAREVWRAHGSGVLDDAPAPHWRPLQRAGPRPAPNCVRPPDARHGPRPAALTALRDGGSLQLPGRAPPALAANFTVGELAVLKCVSDEHRHHGTCSAYVDALAARSGTSRSTVQRALRQAQRLGLVTVQERQFIQQF
jgi:hypothetical protein